MKRTLKRLLAVTVASVAIGALAAGVSPKHHSKHHTKHPAMARMQTDAGMSDMPMSEPMDAGMMMEASDAGVPSEYESSAHGTSRTYAKTVHE